MKLLYLYIEDYGCIKDQEFNFDSNYHFHLAKDNPKVWRIIEDKVENPLPKDFWASSSGKHNVVESVSAIIGKNGSGKTTLARFIGEELERNWHKQIDKYIAIYEFNSQIIYQYNLSTKLVDANQKTIRRNFQTISPAMMYYSPFMTSEHPFASSYVIDISTTHLLNTRAEQHENVENQYNAYQAGERRGAINFLAHYHKIVEGFSSKREININLPFPRSIRIIHPKNIRDLFIFKHLEKKEHHDIIERVKTAIAQPRTNDFYIRTFIDYIATWCVQHINDNLVTVQSPSDDFHGMDRIKLYLDCLDEIYEKISSIDSAPIYLPEDKYSTPDDKLYKQLYGKIVDVLKQTNDNARLFFEKLSLFLWHNSVKPETNIISDLGISCKYIDDEDFQKLLEEIIDEYSRCKINFDFLRFEFDPPMSSGEMAFLSMYSRLYEGLNKYSEKQDSFILFLDEAETTLHPEWQRSLVSNIIIFLEFFSGLDRLSNQPKIQVIFASHSPILLSDIPESNVIFLKKGKNGCVEVVASKEIGHTFGANIYSLYKNSFFMDEGLMGKFATEKIKNIFVKLKMAIDGKQSIDEAEKQGILKVINYIGEPLIKEQLLRLLTKVTQDFSAIIEYHKQEAERLEHLRKTIEECNHD